jgi:hypothetical protein
VPYTIEIDDARLDYAHNAYVQGVQRFSVVLESGDPDHYKRAGALLNALYLSRPIVSARPTEDIESVDTICTPIGVSYHDSELGLAFAQLYSDHHNELTAFALSYDCCRLYEDSPTEIDLEYVKTACVYLQNNGNLSVESLFMLFKSLMR